MSILEVAVDIVGVLAAICAEWKDCKAEDALVMKITERIGDLQDPIMEWAKAQGLAKGMKLITIKSVLEDLHNIKDWLKQYRDTGKMGILQRCAKMAKNADQKFGGSTTSFEHLLAIVEEFEEKLCYMLKLATLGIAVGVNELQQQQHCMMQELHKMSKVLHSAVCVCECVCDSVSVPVPVSMSWSMSVILSPFVTDRSDYTNFKPIVKHICTNNYVSKFIYT